VDHVHIRFDKKRFIRQANSIVLPAVFLMGYIPDRADSIPGGSHGETESPIFLHLACAAPLVGIHMLYIPFMMAAGIPMNADKP